MLPVAVFIWFWWKDKFHKAHLGWSFLAAVLIAGLFDKISSKLFYDTRPFVSEHIQPLVKHAADNGFPSEHTLLAATVAAVIYFFDRRIGIYLAVVALLIGASRVAAHVHSPIDILGSLVFAAIAGWTGYNLAKKFVPAKPVGDRQ